jgi:phage baseplate assembly protein W
MTTSIGDIRATDWQPKLGGIGEVVEGVDDINQCIRIILGTRKGSVPHRPEFGSDIWKYIDYPVNEAIPHIIRESIDAINAWETRIEIRRVAASVDGSTVTLAVEWAYTGSTDAESIEVTI